MSRVILQHKTDNFFGNIRKKSSTRIFHKIYLLNRNNGALFLRKLTISYSCFSNPPCILDLITSERIAPASLGSDWLLY